MIVAGIVAEFNPFHKGHEYLIKKARELTGADYVVVVMSGDFVQRGAPAIFDKYTRTRMALLGGADVVFELPVVFATGSAETFATEAVRLLASLGVVDFLVFGSESGDIDAISRVAELLANEPAEYQEELRSGLKQGLSFPKAREIAVEKVLQGGAGLKDESTRTAELLSSPNNILGVEYCKAILRLKQEQDAQENVSCFKIPTPVTVTRVGSGYLDDDISGEFPSATAIRKTIIASDCISNTQGDVRMSEFTSLCPICEDDFSDMLWIKLEELRAVSSSDLYSRILRASAEPLNFSEICAAVKSKNCTYTAVSRALIHILLGIDEQYYGERRGYAGASEYARLLGFKKASSEVLRCISDRASCELVTKLADARQTALLDADIKAAGIYNRIVYRKAGELPKNEYRAGVVME